MPYKIRNYHKIQFCLILLFVCLIVLPYISGMALGQSTNQTQNNSTANSSESGLAEIDHRFMFSNLEVDVVDKSINNFLVRIHNPQPVSKTLTVDGLEGQNSRNSVVFRGGQTRTLNLTPYSPLGIYGTASISEFAPRDEVVGQNRDLNDTVLFIEYYLIQPVTQPPVPHNIVIVFLGGLSVLLMLASGFYFNARPTRVAKAVNRDDLGITDYLDGPDYAYDADDSNMVKLVKFLLNWIKAWGLIILNTAMALWGLYRFFGFSAAGKYIYDFYFFKFDIVIPQIVEDSMVYILYGHIMFILVFFLGMYIAEQQWIELSDVAPKKGDNYLYYLTPPRFRDMTVIAEVKKPDPDKTRSDRAITYEVPHDWLFEVNKETKGDSYEVYDYDIHNNVAKVSWSGELKKLNPSKLRQSKNTIEYVMETSMWSIDRYYKFLDFYSHDVLMEARHLLAEQTAIRQNADMEGLGDASDRVESRMESRGEAQALAGDELAVAQDVEDIDDFDLIEKKQQKRDTDTNIIDSNENMESEE